MDVMIDLETFGLRPDAAIMQIGAVLFEPTSGGKILNGKGFNYHVLLQDGVGTVDHGTMAWWLTQKTAASMGLNLQMNAHPMTHVLKKFLAWPNEAHDINWEAINGVWAQPSNFDLPILASAFAKVGMNVPWDRRAARDTYTLYYLAGGRPEIDWTGFVDHDALDDAVGQAMMVQKAMKALGR